MTREEAKRIFLNRGMIEVDGGSIFDGNKWREACRVISEWLEQEPCEDAVSRQAVFETIDNCNKDGLKGIFCSYDDGERFKEYIKKLPPVTPTKCIAAFRFSKEDMQELVNEKIKDIVAERKKGKWIYDKTIQNWRCSECNETPKTLGFVGTDDFMVKHFRFCNHCGAEMESEE